MWSLYTPRISAITTPSSESLAYDYETNAMAQQPCVYPLEKERLLPTFICLTKDNMYRYGVLASYHQYLYFRALYLTVVSMTKCRVRKACTDVRVNGHNIHVAPYVPAPK